MEELKAEFTEETVSFASEWYKKTIKRIRAKVSRSHLKHERRKNRPYESPSQRFNSGTLKRLLEASWKNSALWWHQKPRLHDSIAQYLQVADKYPEILDRAVRHVLGRLGLILETYKFNVTASGNSGSFQEFWFDHTQGDDLTSNPYYPHLLKWSEKMQDTIRNYNEQYTKAIAVFGEIHKLKEEKKRQQALNRWDSI